MSVFIMHKLVKLNIPNAYTVEEFDSWDEMVERVGRMVNFTLCVSHDEWLAMAKDGDIRVVTVDAHSTEELVQEVIDRSDEWSLMDEFKRLETEGIVKMT